MKTILNKVFNIIVHNQQLINTVEGLKAKRIIKKDVDIANATGFSRAVVSNYLSGRVKASDNFITAFESFYKVSVFENNMNTKPDENHNSDVINTLSKSMAKLTDTHSGVVQAHLSLVDQNKKLVDIIYKTIAGAPLEKPSDYEKAQPVIERIVANGIQAGKWNSMDEGLEELDKLFVGDFLVKKV